MDKVFGALAAVYLVLGIGVLFMIDFPTNIVCALVTVIFCGNEQTLGRHRYIVQKELKRTRSLYG